MFDIIARIQFQVGCERDTSVVPVSIGGKMPGCPVVAPASMINVSSEKHFRPCAFGRLGTPESSTDWVPSRTSVVLVWARSIGTPHNAGGQDSRWSGVGGNASVVVTTRARGAWPIGGLMEFAQRFVLWGSFLPL